MQDEWIERRILISAVIWIPVVCYTPANTIPHIQWSS